MFWLPALEMFGLRPWEWDDLTPGETEKLVQTIRRRAQQAQAEAAAEAEYG